MDSEKELTELYIAAQAGDKQSEELFFEKIMERIDRFVRYKVHVTHNDSEAQKKLEDLASAIVVEVLKVYNAKKIPLDGLPPYVITIAYRKINSFFRRGYWVRGHFIALSPSHEIAPDPLTLSLKQDANELQELVDKSLLELPDECKNVFIALMNGRYKEYVREQKKAGATRNQIDMRTYHCRQKLGKLLDKEGYER